MTDTKHATIQDAYRAADATGRPQQFDGRTVFPDYRPGFTTVPQARWVA